MKRTCMLLAGLVATGSACAALDNKTAQEMMNKDGCGLSLDRQEGRWTGVPGGRGEVQGRCQGGSDASGKGKERWHWRVGADPDAAQRASTRRRHQGAGGLDTDAEEIAGATTAAFDIVCRGR